MVALHTKFGLSPDEFASQIARAVYQTLLEHPLQNSFIETELAIYQVIRKKMDELMDLCPTCGSTKACRDLPRFPAWTELQKQESKN